MCDIKCVLIAEKILTFDLTTPEDIQNPFWYPKHSIKNVINSLKLNFKTELRYHCAL